MPPSSNESHMDSHFNVAPESRPESRDSKDSRDYRIENRDPRTDAKEMYGEARRDSQSVKNEKDVRFESRGDDNKEVKHDREAHIEPKNDMKIEKDGFGPPSSQVNWKEPKEYHRGKRCLESAGVHVDPWHISRGNSQGPVEIGKEVVSIEERDHELRFVNPVQFGLVQREKPNMFTAQGFTAIKHKCANQTVLFIYSV
jgi:hypothetical protein